MAKFLETRTFRLQSSDALIDNVLLDVNPTFNDNIGERNGKLIKNPFYEVESEAE